MECTACGAELAPHDSVCGACGVPVGAMRADAADANAEASTADAESSNADSQPSESQAAEGTAGQVPGGEAYDEAWRDQPTQTMPAVMLPDYPPSESEAAANHPVGLAPPLAPDLVETRSRGAAGGHGRAVSLGLLAGVIAVLAIALVAAIGVLALGGLDVLRNFDPQIGALTAPDPTATVTPANEDEEEAADGSFGCEPQQSTAPDSGRWTLHRAQFGTRAQFDYLTLLLRRSGQDDGTASVRAELMAPDEVPARYGLQAPAGDAALVLVFDGPVRIPGDFGGRPGHRALQEFRIVRNDGTVHAVVGVNGSGCFALAGADWQAGRMPNRTELTVQIER